MKRIYALLATLFINSQLFAQAPLLLKDICNSPNGASVSFQCNYTLVNGITFFTADDGVHGTELWKTDGTESGTVMVKDIFPGSNTSGVGNLVNVNGTLFFSAIESYSTNMELWKSDGTEAGTVLVKDIAPGANPSEPEFLTEVNGMLFFRVNAFAPGGSELWKSDGTEAGTVMVKDIMAGESSSDPRDLLDVNGTLFFAAFNPTGSNTNYQLWKSDGTAAGTVLVKDINLVINGSLSEEMVNMNGTLFFGGNDGIGGRELWKSDGTEAGTVMVKNINSTADGAPAHLTVVDSILYFTAIDGSEGNTIRLWKTDGTPEGTIAITDAAANRIKVYMLTNFNGSLFFSGDNNSGTGFELWKTDGSAQGTVMIKDIGLGTGSSYPESFTRSNGSLYFTTSGNNMGLWKTDGTADGTKSIRAGAFTTTAYFTNLYSDGHTLYFTYAADTTGAEPWKSDGSDEGTFMLKNINIISPGSAISVNFSAGVTAIGNTAFFTADDGIHGNELWKTDGTTAGTRMVKDIWPNGGSYPYYLTSMNGMLFFTAQGSTDNWTIFKSDGTAAGTVTLGNTDGTNTFDQPGGLFNLNGTLLFSAHTIYGAGIWKSDGTNAGTILVKNGFGMEEPTNVNGTVFFVESNTLCKTDGTAAGTVEIKNIWPNSPNNFGYVEHLTSFNGKLFFAADDGIHGQELWVSDGTAAGTVLFKEFVPGAAGSYPQGLRVIGNSLYFSANKAINPTIGPGMYKTDGTTDGIIEITDIDGNRLGTNQDELIALDSTVFFASGRRLWKTSTTDSVATLVKVFSGTPDLNPMPRFLTAVNGTLYFNAGDTAIGEELWKSDGTEEGTVPMDILPGAGGSLPRQLTRLNNSLIFAATDPIHGEELWILKMEPFIWRGNISTAWETAGNWNTNEVPTATSVVMIPEGRPNYPIVSVSTTVKSIQCAEGSSVTVLTGVELKMLKK